MDGIFSIHISSLIATIQAYVLSSLDIQASLFATPFLRQIFMAEVENQAAILVSTSQAPVSTDLSHPAYNFRHLGLLSNMNTCLVSLESSFSHAREVLAINPGLPLSEIQHLKNAFQYMDLNIDRHFVILFKALKTTPLPFLQPLSALASPFDQIGTLSQHKTATISLPETEGHMELEMAIEEHMISFPANDGRFVLIYIVCVEAKFYY